MPCKKLLPDAIGASALCVAMLCAGVSVSAAAQTMGDMPGMAGHAHHHDAVENEKLGRVSFPTSCAAGQQAGIERGVALLHSFGYTEAQRQFELVVAAEPGCAMAHWGVAMSQFHEIWGRPEPAAMKMGMAEMGKARELAKAEKTTARERGYIDALYGFYAGAGKDYQGSVDGYAAAMKTLYQTYPKDTEAGAFYALAVLASTAPGDTSLTHERTALSVLIPLFKANPEHPGLAHYIIHTCDTPELAEQGLEAARVYARIAPSSAHALHMPGHIFARRGMWKEDIQSNLASVAASERAAKMGMPGVAHQMHAKSFLIYAYLQVGEDDKARALENAFAALCHEMDTMPGMDDMKGSGKFRANRMAAIYALENHQWKEGEKLEPMEGSKGLELLSTEWVNVIGAARAHDAEAARAGMMKFDALLEEIKQGPMAYVLTELGPIRDEMKGWVAYAESHPEDAVRLMRQAAFEQDKIGQGEVDIPAREMLGDLLVLEGKPAEALAEYTVALRLSPNRLNGLLSAGRAAEEDHQAKLALVFYKTALQQTRGGSGSSRPELAHAAAVVAGSGLERALR